MFFVGVVFWTSFNAVMDATNTLGFCTSCHEMTPVFEEYKTSVHYQNASGVRAVCSDCHVPKPWGEKVLRKVKATFKEVPYKLLGKIDTPEKFEAHRLELARDVWKVMKGNNSRECRNCHSTESMDVERQDKSARKKHSAERMVERDETCIDCHKGIAHELPEDYEEG